MTTHDQYIVAGDWLSVSQLLSLGLPGIVASPAGIVRQARTRRLAMAQGTGSGRSVF